LQTSPFDLTALRYPIRKSILALSMFFFIQGVCFGSWASRIPDLKVKLGLSEGTLGSILFFLPMGQLTMMPFSGRIATRFGTRNVLRLALAGYASVLFLIGNVSQPWQLAVCLYLFGLVGNLCNISVNTQGVNTESIYGKPIFTTFHGLWSLGGFTGALIGLIMMRFRVEPAMHFLCITIIVIASDIFFQRYLIPKKAVNSILPKYRISMPEGQLLQLGIIAFCSMSVEGCMFDWTGVYFREVIRANEDLVSAGYAAFMVTMAGGRFFGDRLSVRFGRKNWVKISGVLIFTGLMMIVLFPFLTSSIIGCMITGIGVSSIIPLMYSSAGKESRIASGIAIASVAGIGYLGFLLGPPVIGHIADAIGLQYSFALMALGGLAINLLVRRVEHLN